jgi:hypothetical protein
MPRLASLRASGGSIAKNTCSPGETLRRSARLAKKHSELAAGTTVDAAPDEETRGVGADAWHQHGSNSIDSNETDQVNNVQRPLPGDMARESTTSRGPAFDGAGARVQVVECRVSKSAQLSDPRVMQEHSKDAVRSVVGKRGRRLSAAVGPAPASPIHGSTATRLLSDSDDSSATSMKEVQEPSTELALHQANEVEENKRSRLASLPTGSRVSASRQHPLKQPEGEKPHVPGDLREETWCAEASAFRGAASHSCRSGRRQRPSSMSVKNLSRSPCRKQLSTDDSLMGDAELTTSAMRSKMNASTETARKRKKELESKTCSNLQTSNDSKMNASTETARKRKKELESKTCSNLQTSNDSKMVSEPDGLDLEQRLVKVADHFQRPHDILDQSLTGSDSCLAVPDIAAKSKSRMPLYHSEKHVRDESAHIQERRTKQVRASREPSEKVSVVPMEEENMVNSTLRGKQQSLVDANNNSAADLREIVLKQRIRVALESTRTKCDASRDMLPIAKRQTPSAAATCRVDQHRIEPCQSVPEHEDERLHHVGNLSGPNRIQHDSWRPSFEQRCAHSQRIQKSARATRQGTLVGPSVKPARSSAKVDRFRNQHGDALGPRPETTRRSARSRKRGECRAPIEVSSHLQPRRESGGLLAPPARPLGQPARIAEARLSLSSLDGCSTTVDSMNTSSAPLAMEDIARQAASLVQAAAAASPSLATMTTRSAMQTSHGEAEELCWLWLRGPDGASQPARRVVLRNLPPSTTEDKLHAFLVHVMAAACCFSYDYVRWHQQYSGWIREHPHGAAMAVARRFGQKAWHQEQLDQRAATMTNESAALADENRILAVLKLTPIWDLQLVPRRCMAFVECLTVSEATGLVYLNGLLFQGHQLLIKRPREFDAETWIRTNRLSIGEQEALRQAPARFRLDNIRESVVSPEISMNDLPVSSSNSFYGYLGQIPFHLNEYAIVQWLRAALAGWPWRLAAFRLAREGSSGLSRGFAFFRLDVILDEHQPTDHLNGSTAELALPAKRELSPSSPSLGEARVHPSLKRSTEYSFHPEKMLEQLRSTPLPGCARPLLIRQANAYRGNDRPNFPTSMNHQERLGIVQNRAFSQDADEVMPPERHGMATGLERLSSSPDLATPNDGNVLVLIQFISPEQLADAEECKEILEQVEEEMKQFGEMKAIRLDERPNAIQVGSVYIHFTNPMDAAAAAVAMQNRRFDGRPVHAKLLSVAAMEACLRESCAEKRLVVLPGVIDKRAFVDAAERADIALDIREEMLQFADSVDVEIPVPPDPDAGAALIRFPDEMSARRAAEMLRGRVFDGHPVRPYLR